MILPTTDLALLRERPHRTELFLSIYKPNVIMQCQTTGTMSRNEIEIPYDNSSYSGTYTQDDILPDMTLLIGTSIGASDVGKVRIRTGTSSEFIVAENSDISWNDDLYLTVLNYVDVWTVYPKHLTDPANDENILFYKDYDIEYTNQNEVLGSFPCAGPHRAAFLDGGVASIYYTATGTVNVNGESPSYLWEFEGSPTGTSTLETPGIINYTQPGHYKTTLTVTTTGTCSDVTHRFVSIYDRENEGGDMPIVKWDLFNLSGSRAEGGYTATIRVHEHIDDIQDNSLVVIFADDWYGNTKTSLGGNSPGNSTIMFVGYILKGTIQYNYRESYVEFDIGNIHEMMRRANGFSISCESVENPTTWFEIQDMNVPKALYHYLRWHSTVLKVADFQYTGDARKHQYFDTDRESLFDAIDNFLRVGVCGEVISDRQGKLWAEIDVNATHEAPTSIPTTMIMNNQDWMGEPSIEESQIGELSYLEAGGVAYNGPTLGTFSILLSQAPGAAPSYRGTVERMQGLILVDQAQLNDLAGDVFAYKNAKHTVSMQLAGNYRNIDIAPKELCKLNIGRDDTVRGIQFTNKAFHPMSMGWNWSSEKAFLYPNVVFNEVTNGIGGETEPVPAETVDVPVIPDTGGFNIPDFVMPNFPPFSWPAGGIIAEYMLLERETDISTDEEYITWETSIGSGDAITWLVGSQDTVNIDESAFYLVYVGVLFNTFASTVGNGLVKGIINIEITNNFWSIPLSIYHAAYIFGGGDLVTNIYNTVSSTTPIPLQAGSKIKLYVNNLDVIIGSGVGVKINNIKLYVVKIADLV
jgi:hypothetical protein